MVDANTWRTAPLDAYIVGVKELPEDDEPLVHKHVYFGHAYKVGEGVALCGHEHHVDRSPP